MSQQTRQCCHWVALTQPFVLEYQWVCFAGKLQKFFSPRKIFYFFQCSAALQAFRNLEPLFRAVLIVPAHASKTKWSLHCHIFVLLLKGGRLRKTAYLCHDPVNTIIVVHSIFSLCFRMFFAVSSVWSSAPRSVRAVNNKQDNPFRMVSTWINNNWNIYLRVLKQLW